MMETTLVGKADNMNGFILPALESVTLSLADCVKSLGEVLDLG